MKLNQEFFKKAFWITLAVIYIFVLAKIFISWKKIAYAEDVDVTIVAPIPVPVNVWQQEGAVQGQGVWVYSPNEKMETKGGTTGVYVWNTLNDPLNVLCVSSDPTCAFFTRQSGQEKDKMERFLLAEEAYLEEFFTNFSAECPYYLKLPGLMLLKEASGEIASQAVDTIAESTCRTVVENFGDLAQDVYQATRMVLAESLVNTEALDAEQKLIIGRSFIGTNQYEQTPIAYRLPQFLYDVFRGIKIEPNTSLVGLHEYLTTPRSNAQLSFLFRSFQNKEEERALKAVEEEYRIGGQYFGKYQCIQEVINPATGEKSCGKFFSNLPAGTASKDLQKIRDAVVDVFVTTIDFNTEIGRALNPAERFDDDRSFGGIPSFRDLLNAGIANGPGMFRIGSPSIYVPPVPVVSLCKLSEFDSELVIGLNEARKLSFRVGVELSNTLPGTIKDLKEVSAVLQDSTMATTSPSLLLPSGTTSSEVFFTELKSFPNKSGTTTIEIAAKLKDSAGGSSCRASLDLEVLNFKRYACDSQRCKSPTVNPDPDNPIHVCVGIPGDGINNDCTPLGSNCRTEWCTDIGDKDRDGYNAMCYDSCDAVYQANCQALGYICQATTTSYLIPQKTDFVGFVQKLSSSLFRFFGD
jgi:hypothetical protein